MNVLTTTEQHQPLSRLVRGILIIAVVSVCDFTTGHELAFPLFYIIGISYLAWTRDIRAGISASVVSACLWLLADLCADSPHSHPLIPFLNFLIRLSFLVIIGMLVAAVRKDLEREKHFARVDSLTGAVNPRMFSELLEREIERLRRYNHPFTLASIDLDNFKALNDQHGHLIGDGALRTVVDHAKSNLRKVDAFARLGGDEFALLLPETNRDSAEKALTKLQGCLLDQMRKNEWPITFSIGVVVCTVAPSSADHLLKTADKAMYAVKLNGKNAIKYIRYSG